MSGLLQSAVIGPGIPLRRDEPEREVGAHVRRHVGGDRLARGRAAGAPAVVEDLTCPAIRGGSKTYIK